MPREGSPLGTMIGIGGGARCCCCLFGVFESFVFWVEVDVWVELVVRDDLTEEGSLVPPGSVLHRWMRSFRFANLSWRGERVKISSTHSRS